MPGSAIASSRSDTETAARHRVAGDVERADLEDGPRRPATTIRLATATPATPSSSGQDRRAACRSAPRSHGTAPARPPAAIAGVTGSRVSSSPTMRMPAAATLATGLSRASAASWSGASGTSRLIAAPSPSRSGSASVMTRVDERPVVVGDRAAAPRPPSSRRSASRPTSCGPGAGRPGRTSARRPRAPAARWRSRSPPRAGASRRRRACTGSPPRARASPSRSSSSSARALAVGRGRTGPPRPDRQLVAHRRRDELVLRVLEHRARPGSPGRARATATSAAAARGGSSAGSRADLAAGRPEQPGEAQGERRLAGAVRPGQRQRLAGAQRQVGGRQRVAGPRPGSGSARRLGASPAPVPARRQLCRRTTGWPPGTHTPRAASAAPCPAEHLGRRSVGRPRRRRARAPRRG